MTSAFHPSQYPETSLPEVAFAGRSNVGKSSLINTLLRRKSLVRTSSKPGCTQMINFFNVNDSLYFVDLPGYGYAKVSKGTREKWGAMVEKYLQFRKNLKGVVLILDIRRMPTEGDLNLLEWFKYCKIPCLVVLTKADKLSRSKRLVQVKRISYELGINPEGVYVFSAKTGDGRNEVWKGISRLICNKEKLSYQKRC